MPLRKKLGFLACYLFVISIVWNYYRGGIWTYSGFFGAYIILPFLDFFIGRDSQNVLKSDIEKMTQDRYFDFLVYSHVYIMLGLVLWGAYNQAFHNLTLFERVGQIVSIGTYGGTIINVAHELGHRNNKTAQFHARFALMLVNYMHFVIEHNRGHHVHVATPNDPASAKKGQTVYAFWVQTIFGSYRSAWKLENSRIEKFNNKPFSLENEMIRFATLPLLFCLLLTVLFSWWAGYVVYWIPIFYFAQSLIAILLLECVNYVEHYGISRKFVNGRYERVNPLHSWNANHAVSNLVLFQLQRHSDHHAFASRPYQVLRHFDESPQLPFGYPLMILMSLCPPLWFSVMDKRLEEWKSRIYENETTLQYIHK